MTGKLAFEFAFEKLPAALSVIKLFGLVAGFVPSRLHVTHCQKLNCTKMSCTISCHTSSCAFPGKRY